jgi:hypothetical protein
MSLFIFDCTVKDLKYEFTKKAFFKSLDILHKFYGASFANACKVMKKVKTKSHL